LSRPPIREGGLEDTKNVAEREKNAEEEEKPAEGGRERAGEELVGANYIYLI